MKKTVMICATILALVATVACMSKVIIEDTAHFPDSEIVKSSEASEEDEEFLCVSWNNDWYEAFDLLKDVIKRSRQRRKVVFLDELPWMDTQKSEFLKAIDLFWNSWGNMQQNLLFVVCGSAASWMVKNIIRSGRIDGRQQQDFFGRTSCALRPVGKPIVPTEAELQQNPRSRSAKLRIAEKIEN